jgi:hypothetical protein
MYKVDPGVGAFWITESGSERMAIVAAPEMYQSRADAGVDTIEESKHPINAVYFVCDIIVTSRFP